MIVIANKVDQEDKRQVSKAEVKDWCSRQNIPFFETSAKEGKNSFNTFTRNDIDILSVQRWMWTRHLKQ